MKCVKCGSSMFRQTIDRYHFRECLDGVWLHGGLWKYSCSCSARAISINRVGQLHEAIGRYVATSKQRLRPQDVTFLRSNMDMTGRQLARMMGRTAETVSRWEHGKINMDPSSERLLRMISIRANGPGGSQLSWLEHVGSVQSPDRRIDVRFRKDTGWRCDPEVG